MAKSASSGKNKANGQTPQRKRAASPVEKSGRRKPPEQSGPAPIIDDGTKRTIIGIVFGAIPGLLPAQPSR